LFVKFLLPFRGLYRTFVFASALLATVTGISKAQNTCALNSPKGKIKHVIYVQFDNTHFVRDNPNVPSDLEQMPLLLREVFRVHAWFISITLGIFGMMTWRFAGAIAGGGNSVCGWFRRGAVSTRDAGPRV